MTTIRPMSLHYFGCSVLQCHASIRSVKGVAAYAFYLNVFQETGQLAFWGHDRATTDDSSAFRKDPVLECSVLLEPLIVCRGQLKRVHTRHMGMQ